jgi:hypothetical protein
MEERKIFQSRRVSLYSDPKVRLNVFMEQGVGPCDRSGVWDEGMARNGVRKGVVGQIISILVVIIVTLEFFQSEIKGLWAKV